MQKDSKIYIAGHNGMVGSAIKRLLEKEGYTNIIGRSSKELDLKDQKAVAEFFAHEKPEYVFLCAAKVGGIQANNLYRGEFIYDNLMIQSNIIESARQNNVKKLLFMGSSCIYPKLCPQPIKEEYLLTSALEPTNEAYAIAKIAGLKMCEFYRHQYGCNFISVMPTNLYGPEDYFNNERAHVLPALMQRFHTAKETKAPSVEVWGTGSALREFLHVDDLAKACLLLMNNYDEATHINIGSAEEVSIKQLVESIKKVVGYEGELIFDTSKPDGTPRKILDSSKLLALGWKPEKNLEVGLSDTYNWFLKNQDRLRK